MCSCISKSYILTNSPTKAGKSLSMLTSPTNQCLRHHIPKILHFSSYEDWNTSYITTLNTWMEFEMRMRAFCENCCNWESVRVILEARFSHQQPVGSSLTIQYWFMISTYVTQAGKSSIAFLKNFKVYKNILRNFKVLG